MMGERKWGSSDELRLMIAQPPAAAAVGSSAASARLLLCTALASFLAQGSFSAAIGSRRRWSRPYTIGRPAVLLLAINASR
jgi:peptidoglycan biosynthesis protein MviN/MurJ (putative lipid II flippase)